MKTKLLSIIAIGTLAVTGSQAFAAGDDFQPINAENFAPVPAEYKNVQASETGDDYVRSYSKSVKSLQDIEPAAGSYEFETPNTGIGEAIF